MYTTHPQTAKCRRGAEGNRRQMELRRIRRLEVIVFLVGGQLLESVGK